VNKRLGARSLHPIFLFHNSRQRQEFGADLQARVFDSLPVDFKPDPASFNDKPDHAPLGREALRLTHGEHSGAPQSGQDGRRVLSLIPTDEDDLAAPQIVGCPAVLKVDRMTSNGSPAERSFKFSLEGIVPRYADFERCAAALESI
jgi:hypothetical protein